MKITDRLPHKLVIFGCIKMTTVLCPITYKKLSVHEKLPLLLEKHKMTTVPMPEAVFIFVNN